MKLGRRRRPAEVHFCLGLVLSVGCALLLGTSLFAGTLLAGGFTWAIPSLQRRRLRRVEFIATTFTLPVGLSFVIEMPLVARVVAHRALAPPFGGADGIMLAAGVVGATLEHSKGRPAPDDGRLRASNVGRDGPSRGSASRVT
jgi:drug/metabolite transporter (DMT)-like permease